MYIVYYKFILTFIECFDHNYLMLVTFNAQKPTNSTGWFHFKYKNMFLGLHDSK